MKKNILGLILFITFNTQCLKIDRVILSTDSNPDYIQFWPIVAKVWKDYIGIKPTLALIADKSVIIDESLGDVIRFEPIPGVKTSLQAQVIRLLLPAYFQDEVCLISDIDMIPLNKNYFFDSVKDIKEDCFVTFRNYYYRDTTTIYPMCYNAAKGKVFKEIFKINNIYDIPSIVQNWSAANLGWSTDEILLLKYLRNWKYHDTRCIHLNQYITGRVDRSNNLSCNLNSIKNGSYIDAHCPRPFEKYKSEINNILNALIPDFYPSSPTASSGKLGRTVQKDDLSSENNTAVHITCDSHMLGNRLFIFCYSKILAEQLNAKVIFEPIKGFPNTYNLSNKDYKQIIKKHGYFQRYEYYQPYKKQIKEWLKLDTQITPHENKDDVIIHIRALEEMYYLPFEYYKNALANITYNKLYICIDDPNSPFLENFKPYGPIIIKHNNHFDADATLNDFKLIMSFNKIIASKSTFSWWAAFLSDATEIYLPKPNHGMMSAEMPEVNLFVNDEVRYKYIECNW